MEKNIGNGINKLKKVPFDKIVNALRICDQLYYSIIRITSVAFLFDKEMWHSFEEE